MSLALQFNSVSKAYSTRSLLHRATNWAVRDFSLGLKSGDRLGLRGPSGCGKSTIALMGVGLLKPTTGTVSLWGHDTSTWSSQRWVQERQAIQILFQDPLIMLNPQRTLQQNLIESAQIHKSNVDIEDIVQRLFIEHLNSKLPSTFSGGELRRASLARALIAAPKILIADEPTIGLDMHLKAAILDAINNHLAADSALLLISHDPGVLDYAVNTVIEMETTP